MNVAKYPIIGLNQDDDDVNLKPGWCREIWNAIPKNGYSKTGIQNLEGTVVRTNGSLAAGTNTCIGAFPDKPNNRIFYFLHNSNDDHSIWYFKPEDDTHTLVMQTEFLLFDTAYPILSCAFIEDICKWVDNNNENRSVVVARAVAGLYTFNDQDSFEKQISEYKFSPPYPPTTNSSRSIGTSGFNNIASNSYQFCVQYGYYDDTRSQVSPLSKINIGDIYPLSTNTRNRIDITHNVDLDIYPIIKKIYWIYVKNDDGNYQLFKETDIDTVDPGRAVATYLVQFYDTSSVQTIFPSQVNFIPRKSKNTAIHDQRSITTMNEFDYEQSTVTVSLALSTVGTIPSPFTRALKIFPPNSSVTAGFLFFDRFGRTPGITASATKVIPNILKALKLPSDDQNIIQSSDQLRLDWSVTGTVPSWAKTCAIAIKRNNTLDSFYACLAFPMFYKRNGTDADTYEIEDNGKIYWETPRNSWTKQLYWKIPVNAPFQIDGSFKMRLLNSGMGNTRDVESIIAVEGDKVITENFGIEDWLILLGANKGFINVIFERYKEEKDEVFFEIGDHQDCSSGSLVGIGGTIEGDSYYMESKLKFERVDARSVDYGGSFGDVLQNGTDNSDQPITVPIISQSPVHSNVTVRDVQTQVERAKKGIFKKVLGAVGGIASAVPGIGTAVSVAASTASAVASNLETPQDDVTTIDTVKLVYTPDYNKIASDSGRPWIDVINKKISYEPNTLSISDPYIINSKINGISDYKILYQIPISRTPISKMISIGASHIALLVHERSATSITTYNGKILNTTDGSQIIGDGSEVVGYDNELSGGYGTIYPDSVVHHYNRVYWFDPYSGEVCRYANNGITPIGSIYKMHNFFREKGDQFMDTTGRNVIGGYDANLDILFLTFRSADPDEEVTVAFVDRQGEERWISFEEFLPERYAYINEKLYGFVNGVMWEFNANATRNLFFGVQYTTRVRHLFNTEFSREKHLTNIGVESNKKWVFDPITVDKYGVSQETSLAKSNFVRRDDVFYADVKRDKNTAAGLLPPGKTALVAGQPMIGKVYDITLENDDTELVELDFLNYGFIPSPGHNII